MKNLLTIAILVTALTLSSCFGNYLNYSVQLDPNVPDTYDGRDVNILGTIYVSSKNVTFYVWDSGSIDGDIVSLIVNGNTVLDEYTLTGSEYSVDVSLSNSGYNYVMLYAHNEGDIPPNTCALDIDDGYDRQSLTMSADLYENGAYNIYVE
jgi:hypothetical protein